MRKQRHGLASLQGQPEYLGGGACSPMGPFSRRLPRRRRGWTLAEWTFLLKGRRILREHPELGNQMPAYLKWLSMAACKAQQKLSALKADALRVLGLDPEAN